MLFNFASKIRNSIWRATGAITIGVRVISIKNDSVLLIQHTYRDGWYLPGGGLKISETLEDAARREVYEETGLQLGELSLIGVYSDFSEGRSDHVIVFSSEVLKHEKKGSGEIEYANFFALDELPKNLTPGSLRRIQEYMNKQYPNHSIW